MRASKVEKLGELMVTGGSVLNTPRRAARRLARVRTPAAALALASAVAKGYDQDVADIACRALARLDDQAAIDEVCQVWSRQPVEALDRLVARLGWVASRPAYARARSALRVGRPEVLADGDGYIATSLVGIADHDRDSSLRPAAREAMAMLHTEDARAAVCAAAIDDGSESALQVVAEAGFLPEDPGRRAILLFLIGRHDGYAELDFDGGLLRAAHAAADGPLRRRLAAAARESGRLEWVLAVTAGKHPELSDDEWRTTSALLAGDRQWVRLWRLAVDAPPDLAAEMLRTLGSSGWRPDDEREEFVALVRHAEDCADQPVTRVLDGAAGDRRMARGLTISPDGDLLVVGNDDGDITLWRLPSGEPAGRIDATPGTATGLAVSPDGSLLVSGGSASLRTWRLPSGRPAGSVGPQGSHPDLAISPDGRSVICAGYGHEPGVWRLPALTRTGSLAEQFESVQDLVPSADGTFVAGSFRWGMTVWRWPSLEKVALFAGADGCPVFSPDATLLAGSRNNDVRLWHMSSGEPAATLTGHTGPVRSLAVTPDGTLLASASTDGTVRLWRLPAGEPAGVLDMYQDNHPDPYHAVPDRLAVTADSGLLVCGGQDGTLRVWRLPAGEACTDLVGHSGGITALAVTPDGGQLVSAGREVRLWLPHIMTLSGTPAGRISLTDVDRLRARLGRSVAERPWIELISGLVQRRHRHDIAVDDAPDTPAGATDIEVDR